MAALKREDQLVTSSGLQDLKTLEHVRVFVAEGYRAAGSPASKWNRGRPLCFGFEWGKLPLVIAEPGPLIERAVALAGEQGLTLQEVRALFELLGADRLDRGLKFARKSGCVSTTEEQRPNRAGRPQRQVVLRASASLEEGI